MLQFPPTNRFKQIPGQCCSWPCPLRLHEGRHSPSTLCSKLLHLQFLSIQSCCSWGLPASPHYFQPFTLLTIGPTGAQHGRYLCYPTLLIAWAHQGDDAEKRVINTITSNDDDVSLVLSWIYYFFMMYYFPFIWMYQYNITYNNDDFSMNVTHTTTNNNELSLNPSYSPHQPCVR